jgi:hypothetical protein
MAQLQVELEGLEGKRQLASELAEEALKRRALRDSEEHNLKLREAIHAQRLLLANTTSIISEFMVRAASTRTNRLLPTLY